MNDHQITSYEVPFDERITGATPTIEEELLASRLLSEALALHLTGSQRRDIADDLVKAVAGRLSFGDAENEAYWSDGVLAALVSLAEKLQAPLDGRSQGLAEYAYGG